VELIYDRTLRQEEIFISWSFGPILGADGRTVDGVFCPSADNTEQVLGARRLDTLRRLGIRSPHARTVDAACHEAASVLRENSRDIPFAAIYVVEGDDARLTASVTPGKYLVPSKVSRIGNDADSPWPLAHVLRSRRAADCTDLEAHGVRIRGGHWPELTREAVVVPIPAAREQLAGLLLVGVSPRRPLDAAYRTFVDLIAGHIATAIADAQAYEAEQQRAEALAEFRSREEYVPQ
jgi:GAF domain-containing protein